MKIKNLYLLFLFLSTPLFLSHLFPSFWKLLKCQYWSDTLKENLRFVTWSVQFLDATFFFSSTHFYQSFSSIFIHFCIFKTKTKKESTSFLELFSIRVLCSSKTPRKNISASISWMKDVADSVFCLWYVSECFIDWAHQRTHARTHRKRTYSCIFTRTHFYVKVILFRKKIGNFYQIIPIFFLGGGFIQEVKSSYLKWNINTFKFFK